MSVSTQLKVCRQGQIRLIEEIHYIDVPLYVVDKSFPEHLQRLDFADDVNEKSMQESSRSITPRGKKDEREHGIHEGRGSGTHTTSYYAGGVSESA